jgi:hypothetical protein
MFLMPSDRTNAAYAVIAICLDAFLVRGAGRRENVEGLLQTAVRLLEGDENEFQLEEALLQAGSLLQFGLEERETRSIVTALTASLYPAHFAAYDVTTFVASLVPGLLRELERTTTGGERRPVVPDGMIPADRVPVVACSDDLRTLTTRIRSNQVLWNCADVPDDVFREVLRDHVLV